MTVDGTQRDNRAVGAVAATAASAALACGVCCVLPLAIPAVMFGSVGGILAWFARAYSWMTPVAFAAVISAWLWVAYQSRVTGRRPSRSTIAIMLFATAMLALAFGWPLLEGSIAALIRH